MKLSLKNRYFILVLFYFTWHESLENDVMQLVRWPQRENLKGTAPTVECVIMTGAWMRWASSTSCMRKESMLSLVVTWLVSSPCRTFSQPMRKAQKEPCTCRQGKKRILMVRLSCSSPEAHAVQGRTGHLNWSIKGRLSSKNFGKMTL
jgi:hypothetical protein